MFKGKLSHHGRMPMADASADVLYDVQWERSAAAYTGSCGVAVYEGMS
jgi:hypothetical protein